MTKTGDDTVDSMFDEVVETKITADGAVEVSLVSPSPEEVLNAASDFFLSWKDFRKLNAEGPLAANDDQWWKRLEALALADSRLKDMFCARDRSKRSIRLYHQYRLTLIAEKQKLRADA